MNINVHQLFITLDNTIILSLTNDAIFSVIVFQIISCALGLCNIISINCNSFISTNWTSFQSFFVTN